jgi:phage terminase small subunit
MPARRTTTARKELQGTARQDRGPKREPAARITRAIPPPAHLGEAAAAEWVGLMRTLIDLGTVTQADLRALESLA